MRYPLPDDFPPTIIWDHDPTHYYYVEDGSLPSSFDHSTREVINVQLARLDHWLSASNDNPLPQNFDTFGNEEKIMRLYAHVGRGDPVTPPAISVWGHRVEVAGGNHRLVLCRMMVLAKIPIIIEKTHLEGLEQLIQQM